MVADGTDPTNWDTDGDWLNDFFEIDDDLLDGIRGNSGSPIAMMTELLNSTFHLLPPLQISWKKEGRSHSELGGEREVAFPQRKHGPSDKSAKYAIIEVAWSSQNTSELC